MDSQRSTLGSVSRRRPTTNGARARRARTSPVAPPGEWWDVDAEILATLASGAKSPEEIGAALGMSADAVTSLVAMLAREGKLRIRLVEVV